MHRRTLLGWLSLFGVSQVTAQTGLETAPEPPHTHAWTRGPFYVIAAVSWEEPTYYPPQGLIGIEHCTSCGLLRLPESLWKSTGANLATPAPEVPHD